MSGMLEGKVVVVTGAGGGHNRLPTRSSKQAVKLFPIPIALRLASAHTTLLKLRSRVLDALILW